MAATAARPQMPKCTLSFLSRAGGWFVIDTILYRVFAIPDDTNESAVMVENAETPPDWEPEPMERSWILSHGRVVEWPPGLDK